MKTKSFICVFFAIFMFQACTKKSAADFNSDFSLFKEYLVSFTGGIVSTKTDIRVVLAFDKEDLKKDQVLDDNLFDISPSINGKVVALSPNTIAFVPDKKLDPDTEYQVTFRLDKLISKPKAELKDVVEFNFTLKTLKQDFLVATNDIQSYSIKYQYLNGTLKTADEIDYDTAQKLVTAEQDGKNLKVKFIKSQCTKREFVFFVDSIQRMEEDNKIDLLYDGDDFDIDRKGKIEYPIAGKDNFKVVNVEVPEGNNQTLLINFSDALQKEQDFKGLVNIQNAKNLKFATKGNVLKVFFNEETAPTQKQTFQLMLPLIAQRLGLQL